MSNNLSSWTVVGANVRVKHGQWKQGNPAVWRERGTIVGTGGDTVLTGMNQRGITVYRALVQWPGGETASLLPIMLEPYPSSGELETKQGV